jgi:hypothetical protein
MAMIPPLTHIDIKGMQGQVDIFGNITAEPVAASVGTYTYHAYAEPTPTIQGKMLTVSRSMGMESLTEAIDYSPLENTIKIELATDIALKMLESGMIEFTKQNDPTTDTITYRARCFMTPNDQVQTLRKNGYK